MHVIDSTSIINITAPKTFIRNVIIDRYKYIFIRCSNQKVFDFIPVVEEVKVVASGVVVVVVSGVVVLAVDICVVVGTSVVD